MYCTVTAVLTGSLPALSSAFPGLGAPLRGPQGSEAAPQVASSHSLPAPGTPQPLALPI